MPIGLAAGQQCVERPGMVVVFQVTQLMHDDVFDTVYRHLNQFKVKGDAARWAATAPAALHITNHQLGFRQAVPMGYGLALFQVSADGLLGSLPVPLVYSTFDILPICSVFYPNI